MPYGTRATPVALSGCSAMSEWLEFLDKHMRLDERDPETIREYVEEYNLLALGFQRYCHWGEPYV